MLIQSATYIYIAMKPFVQAVALITAFTAATRIIGFLFRMFLARVLGPEMLGVYQIALSFFMVLLTVIATGLPLVISKEIAKAKERGHTRDIGTIAITGLVISLVVSVALCLMVLALRELIGEIFTDERCLYILMILLPAVVASSIYTSLRAVWWGEKRFFLLGATELLEQVARVLMFVILIGLVFLGIDAAGLAALSFTIACVISAAAVVWLFLRKKSGIMTNRTQDMVYSGRRKSYYWTLIRSAAPITGVRALGSIAIPALAIIVTSRLMDIGWTQSEAMSQYGIVIGMTLPLLMIPGTIISALATALVPELSSAHQRKDNKAVADQIRNALIFTLFITFMLLPVFVALGENIGLFVYDNQLSGRYLTMAAWVMIPLSLNQITNAILNSLGAEMKAMKHYLYGSVVLFAIVWFGTPTLHAASLLIGIGTCMLIASILNLVMISKLTNTKMNLIKMTLSFAMITIPAVLLSSFMFGITHHIWPLMISLGIAGAAGVCMILLLCRIFNIVNIKGILSRQ